MSSDKLDIRWKQRYSNYKKALGQMESFPEVGNLNKFEVQGYIKAFEYTYELAWKTLQDLLKERGYSDIAGPRPVIEQSFQDGFISDGETWMQMVKSRNLTSHSYDEETAKSIVNDIENQFLVLFRQLDARLDQELKDK